MKQLWIARIPFLALCLGLAIFLVGCTAISTPSMPGPLPAISPTIDYWTEMSEPLPTSVTLESGYVLLLEGGLTEAGRSRLEAGETGYFVLAYADRTAIPTENVVIGDRIDHGVFFSIVQPSALGALQEQVSAGLLRYAGPLPPEARLSNTLAEEIKSLAPDTRINIEIRLIAPLNDAQRQKLSQWVIIEAESSGVAEPYLIQGSIEVQYIPDLLSLSVIRWVGKVELRKPH